MLFARLPGELSTIHPTVGLIGAYLPGSQLNRDLLSGLFDRPRGWSGGAMALGKLQVPGRPTIWIIVRQGPIVLTVGADGGVWTFLLPSILSLLFLPLFRRRPDID